jgi:hypothetical protein
MAIDPAILEAMAAAGATAEMIVAAVKADHVIEEKRRAEKREQAAERKRRSRHAMSRNVTHVTRDIEAESVTGRDTPSSQVSSPNGSPTPPPITTPSSPPTHPAADAADAGASRDPRTALFGRGLASLADMTGKTPDSCRSLVGKWLKAADDEAIHVLAAIEDAHRNRIADPVPWINRRLAGRARSRAPPASENSFSAIIRDNLEREHGHPADDFDPGSGPTLFGS